jgi:glycosidase
MKIITNIYLVLILLAFLQIKIFSQVAPGDPNAVKVEFRFYHELASTDSGVGLNGSFNNWLGGVFKMEEIEPNWWFVTLDLLTIGYEYKFVTYTDTVGQAGVTGYFTDPLNPRSGGPFNNSIITVKSPMIYYVIPKNGTNIFDDRPIITTNIGFKNNTSIDLIRTRFWLDGNEIQDAGSYYNSTTRRFTYQPVQGLSYTQHTAILRVFNTEGDSATDSTKFTLQSFFTVGKFTFKFDSKSPTFDFPGDITRVDAKGDFNSQGSTPMNDLDGDGIYTLTTDLEVNLENEYTIIVNSGLYINDPDNPDLSSDYKTYVIKRLQSYPYFLGFNTPSGITFEYPTSPIVISTMIMRSDSLVSISQPSLTAKLNGVTVPITTTNLGGNYELKATLSNLSSGRYILEFFGNDFKGFPAKPIKFVFGIYPDGEGYHFVDNDEDDNGIGTFLYPSNIFGGSADIKEILITSVPTLDSLKINVHLDSISQNTRIGFFIVNNLNGEYVLAPHDANIKIPEWHEKGVYFTIAPLFSPFFNPTDENIVYIARDPMQTSYSFSIDTTNFFNGTISFKIPLTVLESIMGTYRSEWYYSAYTFLKDQNGTIKIDETLGGTDSDESPNIYDATFTGENINQARTMNNFIPISGIGGPRITKIGSNGRGAFKVHPSQIDPQLGLAPEIRLLTIGGEIRTDSIIVYGFAEAPANTEVTLHTTLYDTTLTTNTDSLFFAKIKLNEGENLLSASMIYDTTLLSHSPSIVFNRIVNHNPKININTNVSGGLVTMNADSSYDPDGGNLTFLWEQDPDNPKIVVLNGSSTSIASFNFPVVTGEYYFTLKATSLSGREGWARTVISVSDSGTHIPDMRYWHPAWVDTQIVYSIFVRAFSEAGNFTEITNRIPQLKELGINTIWLLPVHPTTNNIGPDNPGYAITDYYGLYENYGTSVDFKNLINTAHQYGIKIVMDHVIQHTSILHPFMKDANVNKQYSPYYPFYMWDANNNFQYLFTWVDLPSINYEEESTRNYLLDMANYWVHDFNIDGFRCDVAWAINDLRTSGAAYWKSFRSKLKKTKPDVFLLAEADAEYPRYFDEKFDAAYDWSWFNNVKSIFGGSGSIDSLNAAIEYYFNPSFPENARPFKFTENQDEQRFIEAYGLSASKLASTLLFSSPGIPMLYAGQEVGEFSFRGIINWNDPYNLRPFYKKLTRMRHDNSSLSKGDYTRILNSTPTSVLSFLRTYENNDVITICNFNSSQVTTTLQVPIEKLSFDSTASFYLNDIVNNQYFSVVGSQLRNYTITTPAVTARVLVLSDTPLAIEENSEELIPIEYSISQNYPNPFNPSTRINYSLPFPSKVKISIFNILGEKIADLINGEMNAGYHDIQFNASTFATGVYFYFIEAKSLIGNQAFQKASKMILLK